MADAGATGMAADDAATAIAGSWDTGQQGPSAEAAGYPEVPQGMVPVCQTAPGKRSRAPTPFWKAPRPGLAA